MIYVGFLFRLVPVAIGAVECCQVLCHHAGGGKVSLEGLSFDVFRGHGLAMDGHFWTGAQSGTQRHAAQAAKREAAMAAQQRGHEAGGEEGENDEAAAFAAALKVATRGRESAKYGGAPRNGTALWWACVYGQLAAVKYLVQMYKPLVRVGVSKHTHTHPFPRRMPCREENFRFVSQL